MVHVLALLIAGAVPGFFLGIRYGRAHARALRAWRDFRATQQAIKGLFSRTIAEWRQVVKVGVIAGLVVLAGLWVVIANVAHA